MTIFFQIYVPNPNNLQEGRLFSGYLDPLHAFQNNTDTRQSTDTQTPQSATPQSGDEISSSSAVNSLSSSLSSSLPSSSTSNLSSNGSSNVSSNLSSSPSLILSSGVLSSSSSAPNIQSNLPFDSSSNQNIGHDLPSGVNISTQYFIPQNPNENRNHDANQSTANQSTGIHEASDINNSSQSTENSNSSSNTGSTSEEGINFDRYSRGVFEQLLQILVNNVYSEQVIRDIINGRYGHNGPPKPPKMDETARENLPRFKYDSKKIASQKKIFPHIEDGCSVCLCDFEDGEYTTFLPCSHHYHVECIEGWIKEHNTCPKCRYKMQVSDTELEKERVEEMTKLYGKGKFQLMELSVNIESDCLKLVNDCNMRNDKAMLSKLSTKLDSYINTLDSLEIEESCRPLRKMLIDRLLEAHDNIKRLQLMHVEGGNGESQSHLQKLNHNETEDPMNVDTMEDDRIEEVSSSLHDSNNAMEKTLPSEDSRHEEVDAEDTMMEDHLSLNSGDEMDDE